LKEGFEKHRDTSTTFVAPLLIALSMTLNVTLSLPVLKLLQTGATKRSRCFSGPDPSGWSEVEMYPLKVFQSLLVPDNDSIYRLFSKFV